MPTKNLRTLRHKMSPERRARVEREVEHQLEEMDLNELRSDLGITQRELADALGIDQSAVSRLVRRKNLQLRTLERLIWAMGGHLTIRAEFPDRTVELLAAPEEGVVPV